MDNSEQRAVFFDCWDTVISFREKIRTWNTEPLKKHCRNRDRIDFSKVEAFSDAFFEAYFKSGSPYEITACQFLNLIVQNFDLELDCALTDCVHEILFYLLPEPMEGLQDFLDLLEGNGIPYAILSNTIYDEDDTAEIVHKLLPKANFRFLLGSSSIGVKKPNPLFFKTGMKRMGVLPENSLYIGDSFMADVVGANRAEMNGAIWLNWRRREKEQFRSYAESEYASLRMTECHSYREVIERFARGELFR